MSPLSTRRVLADTTWTDLAASHDGAAVEADVSSGAQQRTSVPAPAGLVPLVLVPVGATEQHGPHLPLDTDTVIAHAVASRLVDRLPGAWLAPVIGYGSSGEHQSFPGTCSIGHDALHLVMVELARSVTTWAAGVVFVNAHGGNTRTLTAAVAQLTGEGRDVAWHPCQVDGGDLHAGRTETSLMLHLRPESVRLDRLAAGNTAPLQQLLPTLQRCGVGAVSPSGVLGDPRGATAAEGALLVTEMVERLAQRIDTRMHA